LSLIVTWKSRRPYRVVASYAPWQITYPDHAPAVVLRVELFEDDVEYFIFAIVAFFRKFSLEFFDKPLARIPSQD